MLDSVKSEQEELVKLLAESSMSAPFVFKPMHSVVKGKELFDLAWACNNCIILIQMTKNAVHKDISKNKNICRKAITHNLNQAKWGLREWRSGRASIKGENEWRTISIEYNSDIKIAVISVIQCGEAIAMYHDEETSSLNVSCCATMPYESLKMLLSMHGTSIDIIKIIHSLQGVGEIKEIDFTRSVNSYAINRALESNAMKYWPNFQFDEHYNRISAILLSTRGKFVVAGHMPIKCVMSDLNDIFSDISLSDFWKIIVSIKENFLIVEAEYKKNNLIATRTILELNNYDIIINVISSFDARCMEAASYVTKEIGFLLSTASLSAGCLIFCEYAFAMQPMLYSIWERQYTSNIEYIMSHRPNSSYPVNYQVNTPCYASPLDVNTTIPPSLVSCKEYRP